MMTRYVTLVLEANKSDLPSNPKIVLALPDLLKCYMSICVCPMRIMSRGGKRYVLVIVDDYSRLTWTLFLAFIKKTEKRVGHSLVCLRSGHGTEFEKFELY